MTVPGARQAEISLLKWNSAELSGLCRQCIECEYSDLISSEIFRKLFPRDTACSDICEYLTALSERLRCLDALQDTLDVLAISIALFNAFLQVNYTGPIPIDLIDHLLPSTLSRKGPEELHAMILTELIIDGERPYPLVEAPLYLMIAYKMIDHSCLRAMESRPWWHIRMSFVLQGLLDDPVSTIHNLICDEGTATSIQDLCSKDTDLEARWHLELAQYYSYYSYDQKAMFQVKEAQAATGLLMQVTGALGRRTKFQTFDVSQLVVVAKSRISLATQTNGISTTNTVRPLELDLNDDTLLESVSFTKTNEEAGYREQQSDSRVEVVPAESLLPELAIIDPGKQPQLSLLDQCTLLAHAGVIKISAASDDMIIIEQVAAYVARVLADKDSNAKHSNWSVNSIALLARTRVEGHRSRTVERSVLQLQALVDQLVDEIGSGNHLPTALNGEANTAPSKGTLSFLRRGDQSTTAPATERLAYLFCLSLTSKWDMQRELASKYTSIGLIKSALEIFERLESWESIAMCYGVMDQEEKAEAILRQQIELNKPGSDMNKLWCLLGDVTQNKEHWEKSWEVSGKRYARAQRSLGKYYYHRKEHERSLAAYSLSLKINPLNHGAWFMYGCAALETSQFEVAAEAFTRCISIDQSDSESWNNLASALLSLGKSRRRDAWKALKTATSMKYESWRMWENYMLVSLDINEFGEAVRAMRRCIEIRPSESSIDIDVLQALVQETLENENEEELRGLPRMVFELATKVVQPLITHDPRLWRLLARLFVWRGRYSEALDAHEKAYRCLSGKLIEVEYPVFSEVVEAVRELVDAYQSLGPKEGRMGGEVMKDWKFKSRSVVRTLKGRGKNFEGTEGYDKLDEMTEEIKSW